MKNEDPLGCMETLQCRLYALINVWLPCSRAHSGAFMKNSEHAATQPGATRINNCPFILYETSLCVTPCINFRACLSFLLFVTNIMNQKLGHTYFNMNLIACPVAERAKMLWSRDLCVWSGDSKQVGFPDSPLLDALLWIVCVQTQNPGMVFPDCGGS